MNPKSLAAKIVAKLDGKKAFRTKLPLHLDKDKFLHLLRRDVYSVLLEASRKDKEKHERTD